MSEPQLTLRQHVILVLIADGISNLNPGLVTARRGIVPGRHRPVLVQIGA